MGCVKHMMTLKLICSPVVTHILSRRVSQLSMASEKIEVVDEVDFFYAAGSL